MKHVTETARTVPVLAAAVSLQDGVSTASVDVARVQEELRRQGVRPLAPVPAAARRWPRCRRRAGW